MTPINIYLACGLFVATAINLAQIALSMQKKAVDPLKFIAVGLLAFIAWPAALALMVYYFHLRIKGLVCGYCKAEFGPNKEADLRKHVQSCEQNPLVQMINTQYSQIEPMTNALNNIWGLLYKDKQGWDTSDQVYVRIFEELERNRQVSEKLSNVVEIALDFHTMFANEFNGKLPSCRTWNGDDIVAALKAAHTEYQTSTKPSPLNLRAAAQVPQSIEQPCVSE